MNTFRLVRIISVCALAVGCSEKIVAPDPTPLTYMVYVGDSLIAAPSPIFIGWKKEPFFLGSSGTTSTFDLGKADSADYLVITMNRSSERVAKETPGDAPGQVWIDAVRNLQTGKYLGADADGTIHNYYIIQYLDVYDVLDTTTGQITAELSIENLVGPPDGRYVLLRFYDASYIAISSFDGEMTSRPLLVNGPGPDLEVFARPVPEHLRGVVRSRPALEVRRVERKAPARQGELP